ncbi:hypothetical protein FRC03_001325 [Tulasnella sp. 419]|nr:hypothetical protein FRC03_001325 [Tulasnella sp. 419]
MLQRSLGDEFKLHFEVDDSKVEEGKTEDLLDQLVVYLNVARHYRKTATGFTSQYSPLAKEVNLTAWIVDPAIRDFGKHYQRNMNSCNAAVVNNEGRTTKWTPRNDFQVVYGDDDTTKYSLLMGEADSTGETEEQAMCKMAVLSKRSWEIRATLFGQHDHAVLCAYVSEQHCTMYIFYKKENSYIMHQILSFTNTFRTSTEAVGYLRRLYNFVEQARGHEDLDIGGKLKKVLEQLIGKAEKTEKTGSKSRKRQKTSGNATEGQSRPSAPQNSSVMQLAARYNAVTPLTNYPSIFTVKSITNKMQVAKWTTRVWEVELLMSLQSMVHPRYRNRVVEVTEIIQVTDGNFIVMPQRWPLTSVRNLSKSSYLNLCFQLVEGVAFLHAQNVAHCDLKPDNILVKSAWEPYGGLVITDFGNACRVAPGYLCRGYQGTRGWTAPEISNNMEWDPLSADVWATAKMSLYLAKDAAYEDQVMVRVIGSSTPSSRPIISSLYDAILLRVKIVSDWAFLVDLELEKAQFFTLVSSKLHSY